MEGDKEVTLRFILLARNEYADQKVIWQSGNSVSTTNEFDFIM